MALARRCTACDLRRCAPARASLAPLGGRHGVHLGWLLQRKIRMMHWSSDAQHPHQRFDTWATVIGASLASAAHARAGVFERACCRMLPRWSDWPCRSRWPRLLAVVDAAAQPPVCSTTGCGTLQSGTLARMRLLAKQHGFYRIGARRPAAMSKATDGAGVGSAPTHTCGMSARRAFSGDASSAASAPRRVVSAGWHVAQCHFQCQRFGRESGTNRSRLSLRCALRAGIEGVLVLSRRGRCH